MSGFILNLIQAWNKAEEGDVIKHINASFGCWTTTKTSKYNAFNEFIERGFDDRILLDDNWSVVTCKRKTEIYTSVSEMQMRIKGPTSLDDTIVSIDKPFKVMVEREEIIEIKDA